MPVGLGTAPVEGRQEMRGDQAMCDDGSEVGGCVQLSRVPEARGKVAFDKSLHRVCNPVGC